MLRLVVLLLMLFYNNVSATTLCEPAVDLAHILQNTGTYYTHASQITHSLRSIMHCSVHADMLYNCMGVVSFSAILNATEEPIVVDQYIPQQPQSCSCTPSPRHCTSTFFSLLSIYYYLAKLSMQILKIHIYFRAAIIHTLKLTL